MAQRILIAPLDWGLGHTVRCIPIIQKHLQKGDEIVFAGTKQQQEFISQHQITIKCIDLFGYAIQYSAKLPQWLKIAFQLPKILSSIKQEKKWLDEFVSILKSNGKKKKVSEFDEGIDDINNSDNISNSSNTSKIIALDYSRMLDNHNNNIILTKRFKV